MYNNEIQNHIEFLLSMAMNKCDNLEDAQDLVQETLLSVLVYCNKGNTINDVKSMLLTVMNRKYYDILRRKYNLPTVIIGDDFDIIDESDDIRKITDSEEAEVIRREVAYLSEIYRSIIARYYFRGERLSIIAEELSLPVGTVKSRLDFGRKQIKKGFESMENYVENSYLPQTLYVRNSGVCGINDEPMSLVEDEDILAQNLLILAYEKPITISDLARAIAIPAAYIEPVINRLVQGELMKRNGDGKIYTDFIIYNTEDSFKCIKEKEQFAYDNADAYCIPMKKAIEELKNTDFYSERLERYMIINIAERTLWCSLQRHIKPQIFPDRPNGGRWIAFGTIYGSIPKDKQGKENYSMSGQRLTHIDSYLNAKSIDLYNYETSLYSYPKHSGFGYNSFLELEQDMLKLFYLIKKEIQPESVGINTKMIERIPLLEELGMLQLVNGVIKLLIPCLTHEQYRQFCDICASAAEDASNKLTDAMGSYISTRKKKIPHHLKSVPEQKLTMPYEPSAMNLVFEAIQRGVHIRDLGYPCPETFVVID